MIVYYKGLELIVQGEYVKEEPQTLDYPGYPESFEIDSVEWEGVEVYQLFYDLGLLPDLECIILQNLN